MRSRGIKNFEMRDIQYSKRNITDLKGICVTEIVSIIIIISMIPKADSPIITSLLCNVGSLLLLLLLLLLPKLL
jgi:hypothetical protein